MSANDIVSSNQRKAICELIKQHEMERARSQHPESFDRRKNDNEFWNNFASDQTEKLINSRPNSAGCYYDEYSLYSRGLVQNVGYNLEFVDRKSKQKYYIHTDGSVDAPTQWEDTSGCYVATCVYGSYDCPQVWTLRRYRDNILALNPFGRAFIKTYYAISPTLVKWFGSYNWFHKLFKKPLDKLVKTLNSNGVENTPYND